MRRHAVSFGLLALMCAVVGAQGPSRSLPPAEQAKLLGRNRGLLKATIDNSLELGGSNDPLQRVGACHQLVQFWANEVEQAARERQSPRAVEMGELMNRLVERGVAENLRIARQDIKPGSLSEPELFRRRDEAVQTLKKLENQLDDAPRDLHPLRDAVAAGRQSVESAAPAMKK